MTPDLRKPARGSGKLERIARKTAKAGITARLRHRKRLANVQGERQAKAEVRERDQVCRWPRCPCSHLTHDPRGVFMSRLEVSHVVHKGAGGDPALIRTQPSLMLLLCAWRHRGPFGLHAGRARVDLLTDRGTDGPVECFYERDGRWFSAGVSTPPNKEA